jgi:hypothetical protein
MGMTKSAAPRFCEILEYHLNLKLQFFLSEPLNRETMGLMYGAIRDVVFNVFSRSSMNPSTAAKEWLSQQYYELVKIDDSKIRTEDSTTWKYGTSKFYEPVSITQIPSDDLRHFAGIFSDTIFAEVIMDEISARR